MSSELTEFGQVSSGVKMLSEYILIYSGLPSVNKTRTAHGVAVCLNTEASLVWKNSGAEWEPVNKRVIKIRMNCKPINVTTIDAYAPVNLSTTAASQSNDKFYSDLQDTLNKVSSSDMIIFMEDFNARIGWTEHNTSLQTVGPFATDSRTNNDERLVNFCVANNVVISNTFFQHKPVHQRSWMHPRTKKWYTLNYTLVNNKFRSSVENLRFHRKAMGVIGTDHHFMRINVKFHLKIGRIIVPQKHFLVDRTKMKEGTNVTAFQNDLVQKLTTIQSGNTDLELRYGQFVDIIKETAAKLFKPNTNSKQSCEKWLIEEIIELAEKKGDVCVK